MGLQFASVPALVPYLMSDLGFTYTQIGLLIGIFLFTGAFLALPGGMLGAWLGDRRTLQLGLGIMVAGGLLVGVSHSFALAFLGRLIGGVGGVLVAVTAAKVVTDWFAGREIATAMSLLGVTWPVGIALGLSTLSLVAERSGWANAIFLTTIVPAVTMLLLLLFPIDHSSQKNEGQSPTTHKPVWSITRREFWLVVVGGAAWPLMSSGGYVVFTSFAPGLLMARGMSTVEAGLIISLLSWLIILTIPLGGQLADRTGKKSFLFVAGCLVSAVAMLMVPVGGPVVVWIVLSAALGLTVGPVMALPAEVLRPESRSTGMGLFYAIYYIDSGSLPALAGWLQDISGSTSTVVGFSALSLTLAPVSLLAFRLLQRHYEFKNQKLILTE
jgi:predicted MFS family arabinose efflux permease